MGSGEWEGRGGDDAGEASKDLDKAVPPTCT